MKVSLRETQASGSPSLREPYAGAGEEPDIADVPCRSCRGRGYDRRNPDEPCNWCDGEGIETPW